MSEAAGDRLIGTLLGGRYLLESLLGRGGMASVYRARDEQLGRPVAVKVFFPHSADADDMRRQEGEVRMLASLSHPGLVTLFDAGAQDSPEGPRAYLVMELVQGITLRERMRAGPMPSREVASIGADLADALNYIHRREVVHRDVKPANILLVDAAEEDAQASAKLADFGIARIVDGTRLTATGAIIGTVSYLSPEQALGSPLGPPTDIYALGLVLLECLTAERAFPGSAMESASARIMRDPTLPAAVAGDWGALLRAMTAREPDARPTARDAALGLRLIQRSPARPQYDSARSDSACDDATLDGLASGPDTVAMTAALKGPTPQHSSPEPAGGTRSTASTASIASASDTASTSAMTRVRAPRRPLLIAVAAVVVLLLAVGGWTIAASLTPPSASSTTIPYPAVPGELGTVLEQLQRSVEPTP